MKNFIDGNIIGVEIKSLKKYSDERGYLMELWRADETKSELMPTMCYMSISQPNVQRGPHEHKDQTDWFCFFGPANFTIYLWDNRLESNTFKYRMKLTVGQNNSAVVIVPNGVVHSYKNISIIDGLVVNLPNRLFAGNNRTEKIDEIRHELDPNTIFQNF